MDAERWSIRSGWLVLAAAVAAFHVAYAVPACAFLVLAYVAGLLHFARSATSPRAAFYGGLAAGMLVLVVIPLFGMFEGASRIFARGDAASNLHQDLRASVDRIVRDLRMAEIGRAHV